MRNTFFHTFLPEVRIISHLNSIAKGIVEFYWGEDRRVEARSGQNLFPVLATVVPDS